MHPLETRVLLPEDLKPINTLKEYKARGGLKGLLKARDMSRTDLINLVKQSGLRGRGGAGFPTAIKWTTVYNDPASKKYVVCNGAEGEPGTYKDRYMISKNPYQLIEGLLIAAYAVDAYQAVIGTKEKFTLQVNRIKEAIKDFEAEGLIQEGYVRLVLGPDDYLFGEEKALLEVIDGRGAMPRNFPPFLVGVDYKPHEPNPTVVNNAESLSHLPHILSKGVEWFRSNGFEDTPGTMIITLSGDVKRPGMYEVPLGLTVNELLYELGQGPREYPFKAIFSGVANRVMTPDLFDTPMGFGTLRSKGVGLGSGGFIVYDESNCIVAIALMLSRFLADSSCGQCIPCNSGTRTVTNHLQKIEDGQGTQDDIDAIRSVLGRCTNQTRCFLPVQETQLVGSVLDAFEEEVKNHLNCSCPHPKELVLPKLKSYDEGACEFTYEAPKLFVG